MEQEQQQSNDTEPLVYKPVAVCANNSNGERDIYFCIVACTEAEWEDGLGPQKGMDKAESEGYEPVMAYDEDEPASAILSLMVWESVPEFGLMSEERQKRFSLGQT